jgi:hypothetical protein
VTRRLGGAQLVSITNWLEMDKFYIEDAAGGFGFFPYNTINDYDQWSQELRLSGEADRWNWLIGAYYLDMTWDTFQSVQGALILGSGTGSSSETQKMSTSAMLLAQLVRLRPGRIRPQRSLDADRRSALVAGRQGHHDESRVRGRTRGH